MSDEWGFYMCLVDGEPASIFLDMGIARSAPIPGLEKLAYLRVWMNSPRPDGLSSQEEYDTLVAIEDALEAEIGRGGATVYVGRNTSGGRRDFFLYTSDETALRASTSAALSRFVGYRAEFGCREDENWSVYFDFLYPNGAQKQVMANRGVIASLAGRGDDGHTPRPIDHLILVGDRGRAQALSRILLAHGYRLKAGSPSEHQDGRWGIEFERIEAPAEIDDTTVMLSGLAEEHGGDYDGWGCVVVSS